MRISEKGRCAGLALPNIDGLDLQNLLENGSGEMPELLMHESGWDNSGIQLLKKRARTQLNVDKNGLPSYDYIDKLQIVHPVRERVVGNRLGREEISRLKIFPQIAPMKDTP